MYLESDHGTRLVLSAGRCDAARPSGSLVITHTRPIWVQVSEKNLREAPRIRRIGTTRLVSEGPNAMRRRPLDYHSRFVCLLVEAANEGVPSVVKEKRTQAVWGAPGRRLLARRIPSRRGRVLKPHYLCLPKEPSFPHRVNGAAAARNAVVNPSNPSSKKIR